VSAAFVPAAIRAGRERVEGDPIRGGIIMADIQYREGVPVIEVRVLCGDRLLAMELCEDERQVAEVVRRWEAVHGVSFLVDDFTHVHVPETAEKPGYVDALISATAPADFDWE